VIGFQVLMQNNARRKAPCQNAPLSHIDAMFGHVGALAELLETGGSRVLNGLIYLDLDCFFKGRVSQGGRQAVMGIS
jgi:hypothetical protein